MNFVANVTTVSVSDTLVCSEKPFSPRSLHMDRMLSNMRRTSVMEYGGTVDSAMLLIMGEFFFAMRPRTTPPPQSLDHTWSPYPRGPQRRKHLHGGIDGLSSQKHCRRTGDESRPVQAVLAMHKTNTTAARFGDKSHGGIYFPVRHIGSWSTFQKQRTIYYIPWYLVWRRSCSSQVDDACHAAGKGNGWFFAND